MIKKCLGCGIKMQYTNPLEAGYVSKNIKDNPKYCERCFKIIHYNKADVASLPEESIKIVKHVNSKAKYVFFLIDFLNINTKTIKKFKEIKVPKTLIISKCDIIPKSIKEKRIIEFIKKNYQIEENIIFISSAKIKNIYSIKKIMNNQNIIEAYVLGYTNAGKSTLINKIYEKETDNKSVITTSAIPNTTLDFLQLKISNDFILIDSPGFVMDITLYQNDEIELIKRVNTKKILKPITYQTKDNMYLNLEDKIIFNVKGDKNSLTFYLSNNLFLKKEYKFKHENLKNITLKVNDNTDIVIIGVGFINVKKKATIEINTINKDLIEVRPSCF